MAEIENILSDAGIRAGILAGITFVVAGCDITSKAKEEYLTLRKKYFSGRRPQEPCFWNILVDRLCPRDRYKKYVL